ncbi:alpha/beta fold hydrolase [Streptomyces turgidiscabies]|uniref:Proline-specific peptidase n=1 Tax=Streptomyces turgidiscabies TaxID=85558 RepID=A0ABU0RRU3_9ACTN|nr:alpha/beta fold hydrolase [Streptomyces turgidiscabies]MDQ0934706.1 proline-specific peptidase [Streptomyces turgidiscabies]
MVHTLPRRVLGGVLLLIAVPLTPVAAATGSLATASVTTSVPLFAFAGFAFAALVAALLGRAAFALLGKGWRPTVFFAGGLVVAVAVLAAATVFRPMPVSASSPLPSGVRVWNLPTGSRIAYVHAPATGRARPTPVVFLHGGPGTPGEGIPGGGRELAKAGFDVYSYDQLGAGRSTRLTDITGYTVARQVADLDAIRRTLGADQIIIIGQSWGGSLAAQYLAAHSSHVAKAVFTSPGALWGHEYPGSTAGDPWDRLPPAQRARLDKLNSTPRILAAGLLLDVNPGAAHALVGDREVDHWMHEVALTGKDSTSCQGAPRTEAHNNPQGFYSNQITRKDFEQVPDPRPKLRKVRVPSLIMRGECDFIRPAVTYEYRQTLPDSELVTVKGAGHAIYRGRPQLYTALLRAFLLGRPLPATAP